MTESLDMSQQNTRYSQHRDELLEYQKKYGREHKVKINNYNREYYNDNKLSILEKQRKQVHCICGKYLTQNSLYKHMKTKLHEKWMHEKNTNIDGYETIILGTK
tara:strand:- start:2033 stop:2344 length:312 start_codon:yes stop_codon:yes gene_type:complete